MKNRIESSSLDICILPNSNICEKNNQPLYLITIIRVKIFVDIFKKPLRIQRN